MDDAINNAVSVSETIDRASFTPRESGVRIPHRPIDLRSNLTAPDTVPDDIDGIAYVGVGPDYSDPNWHKDPGPGIIRICGDCGVKYTVKRLRPCRQKTDKPLCVSCRGKAGAARADIAADFTCPEATDNQKMRAQAIVNMRNRRGWFTKPKNCCLCGVAGKRLNSHHQDYSREIEVWWICYRCHYRVHRDSSLLDGIPPFICDRKDLPPAVPHGRGGRKGPTGNAKGHAPSRSIIGIADNGDGSITESLVCGHTHVRVDDGHRPVQRRCKTCRDSSPSDVKGGANV